MNSVNLAIGCPVFEAPFNIDISIESDLAVLTCNYTGEIWYLTCLNNKWTGQPATNCTPGK